MQEEQDRKSRIRSLNDTLRETMLIGRVVLTQGVMSLDAFRRAEIMQKVRTFSDFTYDNDPHQEHDFGAFMADGIRISGRSTITTRRADFCRPIPPIPR